MLEPVMLTLVLQDCERFYGEVLPPTKMKGEESYASLLELILMAGLVWSFQGFWTTSGRNFTESSFISKPPQITFTHHITNSKQTLQFQPQKIAIINKSSIHIQMKEFQRI
jgi:hypothetical protein